MSDLRRVRAVVVGPGLVDVDGLHVINNLPAFVAHHRGASESVVPSSRERGSSLLPAELPPIKLRPGEVLYVPGKSV
jgi:hypothetical protein